MPQSPIYLDHQSTTPMDPRVLEVMLPYFTKIYGNPSSRNHVFGWEAAEGVDEAKEKCAQLIGAHPSELIFTSGATESINLALKGILLNQPEKNHIITCATEHSAVLDTCASLEALGYPVTYLPVNEHGLICLEELEAAIRADTGLICIHFANNETGAVQPITKIGELSRAKNIPFFSDATQAVGKIPVSVKQGGVDLVCFSGHKMYGPKGIGILYKRKNISLKAQLEGGRQQAGFRSGTLNVPGIIGLGEACAISRLEMSEEASRLSEWRDELEQELMRLGGVHQNGPTDTRLPHCSNLYIEGVSGEAFILSLGSKLAFSQGAACSSVTRQLSHVLLAMQKSPEIIESSFRFSLGRFNTKYEINEAKEQLKSAILSHRIHQGYSF
ncbi:cysteine desulfurase family protein [Dyadobacter tibetensis]|uniref:cysteine desulfurase family protein n=1 Tax=Dyadobacter tibetensis TaxID=1211851 RepID=UPI000470AA66|nr:cysteine desulfurase family protein [Dyadobacter tibetensis]